MDGFMVAPWVVYLALAIILLLLAFICKRVVMDAVKWIYKKDKAVDKQQVEWGEFAILLADWKLHGLSDIYTRIAATDWSGAIAKGVKMRTKAETKGGMLEMLDDNFVLQVGKRAEDEALCKAAAKCIAKEAALVAAINAALAEANKAPAA